MRNPWILRPRNTAQGRLRLVCLPHAGSGAGAYLGWAGGLSPDIELVAVQLPGRESRLAEPAPTAMADLIAALADALSDPLCGADDRPYVVYGHSMGAFIAFDLVREFRRRGQRLPCAMVLSGARAPHLPPHLPLLHLMPDALLLQEVSRRYGSNFDPEMMDLVRLMLPTLRADLSLVETRLHRDEPPLPLPISAWSGADDAFVQPGEAGQWGRHTAADFEFKVFPGGHFFPSTAPQAFLPQLDRALARHLRSGP
jgi:medium-chain acyl-[acyl-carrier-protein] hydrolase